MSDEEDSGSERRAERAIERAVRRKNVGFTRRFRRLQVSANSETRPWCKPGTAGATARSGALVIVAAGVYVWHRETWAHPKA
jgi:hypothetical protein